MELFWEVCQFLMMLGTLATAMVNTASIRAHTRRVLRLERRVFPVVDANKRENG
jgi:hypothetical protein